LRTAEKGVATMDDRFSTKKLLALRQLTRAIAQLMRAEASEYVAALLPVLRPSAVLGAYAQGGSKDNDANVEKAFKELTAQFESVAGSAPFDLHKELRTPLDLVSWGVELSPVEYAHKVKTPTGEKTITITSPLKWTLSYSGLAPGKLTSTGFTPHRMRELLNNRSRSTDELRHLVLHYLVMHLVILKQPRVSKVFNDLHFPLVTERIGEFGSLPFTCVSSFITTILPPDEVLIEHTEIAGKDAFEEVVDDQALRTLPDPLRDKIGEMIKAHTVP
jgi:hypothetical protein